MLFSIAGLLLAALVIGGVLSSSWFWRRVALKVGPYLGSGRSSSAGASDEELASAIDDLQDELATIHSRLSEAIEAKFFSYKFLLPSAAYTRHKGVISARSSQAREALSEVYVQADALNTKLPGGSSDGIAMEHVRSPDAVELRETVSRAQATLSQLRPGDLIPKKGG